MVQVIMPQTKRMSAFDEAMSNSGNAIEDLGVALFQKKEDETKRQQALNMESAKALMSQGLEVTPESVSKLSAMLSGQQEKPQGMMGTLGSLFSSPAPMQQEASQPVMQQAVQPQEGVDASGFKYTPKKLAEMTKETNQAKIGQLQLEKEIYEASQRKLDPAQRDDFKKTIALDENKTPNQNQSVAAGFATRAETAEADLSKLPIGFGTSVKEQLQASLPGVAEVLKSEDMKTFEQAQRNFISAVLRKESGASIPPSEYASEVKKYFPQAGDTPEVLEQKRVSRNQAVASLKAEAGENAYGRVKNALSGQQPPPTRTPQADKNIVHISAPIPKGKIRVSNGKETFEISESELASAKKDGYKVIK